MMKTKPSLWSTPPPPPTFGGLEGAVLSGGMSPKGFSLVSVLVSSVLGLMVVMGISHNMIQTALNRQIMEKRHLRQDMQTFIKAALNNSASCQNTLSSQLDSGAAKADKNLAPHAGQERKFEIKILKDANGGAILDFSKDASGNLTHQASKIRLSDLGIDRFEKMEFIHSKSQPSLGKVVLKSKTSIGSLHNRQNRELVWHLSGLTIGDPDGADTDGDGTDLGDQVQSCSEAEPLKILCGSAVTGSPHSNGGGFVEDSAKNTVASSAYVDSKSVVCGNAKIEGNAKVLGGALVKDNAKIKDRALVYGNAQISGDAEISGDAKVYDNAKVSGNAKVYGHARVYDNAEVSGGAQVFGRARVYKMATVSGPQAQVRDSAKVYGAASVNDNAQVYGSAQIRGSGKVSDRAHVYENAIIEDQAMVSDDAQVYGSAKMRMSSLALKNAKVYGEAHAYYNTYISKDAELYGKMRLYKTHLSGNCRCGYTPLAGEKDANFAGDSGGNPCGSGRCSPIIVTKTDGSQINKQWRGSQYQQF